MSRAPYLVSGRMGELKFGNSQMTDALLNDGLWDPFENWGMGNAAEFIGEEYEVTRRLQEVPGVGPLTALAFVLVIDDPKRFTRSRDVGAYIGITPRRDQSGDTDKQLPITKCGDALLRRLLVQCAHHILGPFGKDCDLRAWGLKLAERGGKNGKKRAVVAVARKLAVLLLVLWRRDANYEPSRRAA